MMNRRRVAVDDELGNIKSALQNSGYEVLSMNQMGQNPDAIITSGMDDNLMGMEDMQANAPIISARGLSADQVINELNRKMGQTR